MSRGINVSPSISNHRKYQQLFFKTSLVNKTHCLELNVRAFPVIVTVVEVQCTQQSQTCTETVRNLVVMCSSADRLVLSLMVRNQKRILSPPPPPLSMKLISHIKSKRHKIKLKLGERFDLFCLLTPCSLYSKFQRV